MVADSFACPACQEPIPAGRLSCPGCGTVLAAVARRFRASGDSGESPAPTARERSWLDTATDGASRRTGTDAPTHAEEATALGQADSRSASPIPTPVAALLHPSPDAWHPPTQPAGLTDMTPGADPGPGEIAAADVPETEAAAGAVALAADVGTADAPAATEALDATEGRAAAAPHAQPVASRPRLPAAPRSIDEVLRPAPGATTESDAPVPDPPPVLTPSATAAGPAAWIPPSTALEPPTPSDPPARVLPRAWDPAGAAAGLGVKADAPAPVRPGRLAALGLPPIDRAAIDEAAGVVVMAGAVAAAVGFLLPWSRVVIGARVSGSYFDTWGLAGPGHLLVFLLVLGTLALAAIPNRIGSWLRTGAAGVALGGLLLGLAWPYAFGPLGAGVGIVLLVVAACLLLVGGLVSTLVQRHAGTDPAV